MGEEFANPLQMIQENLRKFNSSTEDYEIRCQRETGTSPPKMNPFIIRIDHREAYKKMCEDMKLKNKFRFNTTFTNKAKVSFAPLDTLTRTKISDLRVNEIAKGSYLLARTIEPPILEVGIKTIIEDHTGDVFTFSVYHMFDPDVALRPEDILPLGTVFILKEPLLKTSVYGTHIIRCDSPTDIVLIDASHHLFKDISETSWLNEVQDTPKPSKPSSNEEWKKIGNDKFQKGMFREALETYFVALKKTVTDNKDMQVILYSNISAVYLKIGSFESCLLYSRKALELNPNYVKALYRSGRAHYGLRQYREASQCFEMVLKLDSKNKESANELQKCASRLEEEKGNVDIYKLLLTKTHKPGTEIDCGDFIGPIQTVDVPGKGRGIVATEYIKPGTLLCVSKALSADFRDPLEGLTLEKTGEGNFSDNIKLVTKVAQKVLKNPSIFGRLVYQLSTNDNQVRKGLYCDNKTKKEPVADVERIRKILNTNCFGLQTNLRGQVFGSALFHMPSYFNHSCFCNASWEPYNDILVIHAVKPINCGEEICITYHNNLEVYCERESKITQRKFHCLCLLCKLDRSESKEIHLRRETLLVNASKCSSEDKRQRFTQFKRLVSKLEQTYNESGRSELKCCLLTLYLNLSQDLLQIARLDLSKKMVERALNSVGLCSNDLLMFVEQGIPLPKHSLIIPQICFAMELIAVYYSKSGRVTDSQKWVKILLTFEKLCSGGDINVAKMKYENLRVLLHEVS